MANQHQHKPPEWELYRREDPHIEERRFVTQKMIADAHAQSQPSTGMWWEEQRYVDQIAPADMVNRDKFDHFNFRYQLYARQPPAKLEPCSLAEVTDEAPPLKYNVKRIAVDKPCELDPVDYAICVDKNRMCWDYPGKAEPTCGVDQSKAQGGQQPAMRCVPMCQPVECPSNASACSNRCSTAPGNCDLSNSNNSNFNNTDYFVPTTRSRQSPVSGSRSCSTSELEEVGHHVSSKSASSRRNGVESHFGNIGTSEIFVSVDLTPAVEDSISFFEPRKAHQVAQQTALGFDNPLDNMNNIMNGDDELDEIREDPKEKRATRIVQKPVWKMDVFKDVRTLPSTYCIPPTFPSTKSVFTEHPRFIHGSRVEKRPLSQKVYLEHPIDLFPSSNSNNNNNSASTAATGKKPKVKKREYTLRGYVVKDCANPDRLNQPERLLCRPDKGSLDIPHDRVLVGRRVRQRLPNEPYDEEKDGPLLCRPVSLCDPGNCNNGLSQATTKHDNNAMSYFICEPPPKDPKPKPGYGTYKIIGSKQYREHPQPDLTELVSQKLPREMAEYREYVRRCPDYKVGRYDRSDPNNEMMLPSNISSQILKASRNPFTFLKNPKFGRKLPPLSRGEEKPKAGDVDWRLPEFIVEEMKRGRGDA